MACKVSDLQVLHAKGLLSMDPWDFFRWRIGLKLGKNMMHHGDSGRNFIRTIIYKLCNDERGDIKSPYSDLIMRDAVLLSAKHQNRLSVYRPKASQTPDPPQASMTNGHGTQK